MDGLLEAWLQGSRELLDAARGGVPPEALLQRIQAREPLLGRLTGAAADEIRVTAADLGEIESLEAAILEALRERRDALCEELSALRRGRAAQSIYETEKGAVTPRFVDRAG